jgi:GTP-binding protein
MIADVGLVGLPNAGKSTLLATVSNARPEIANYPFTTLTPNLGVVDIDKGFSVLMADIPGLIEGASKGKGLGDEFLRHIERTSVLVHLVDIYNDDVAAAYETIQKELKAYSVDLSKRPQILVLSKIDGFDEEIIADRMNELKKVVPRGTKIFAFSSTSKQGVKEVLYAVKDRIIAERKRQETKAEKKGLHLPILRLKEDADSWKVEQTDGGFVVTGRKIEKFAARTDFNNSQGRQRLRDIMRKMGILRQLERQGIEPGQSIIVGKNNLGSIEY